MNAYRAAVTLKYNQGHNNQQVRLFNHHGKNQENTFVSVFPNIHSFTTLSVYTFTLLPLPLWSGQAGLCQKKGTGGESTASQLDRHTHLHTVQYVSTHSLLVCQRQVSVELLKRNTATQKGLFITKLSPLLYNAENHTKFSGKCLIVQADFLIFILVQSECIKTQNINSPQHQSVTGLQSTCLISIQNKQ